MFELLDTPTPICARVFPLTLRTDTGFVQVIEKGRCVGRWYHDGSSLVVVVGAETGFPFGPLSLRFSVAVFHSPAGSLFQRRRETNFTGSRGVIRSAAYICGIYCHSVGARWPAHEGACLRRRVPPLLLRRCS